MSSNDVHTTSKVTNQLVIRRASVDDDEWIIDLTQRNARANLSPTEQASGYVQKAFDAPTVKTYREGPLGILVAWDGDQRVGLAMTSTPDMAETLAAVPALQSTIAIGRKLGGGHDNFFVWGPIVVEKNLRGRGILRAIHNHLMQSRDGRSFDRAVSFIEASNSVSLSAHQKLGWKAVERFEMPQGRSYVVTVYDIKRSLLAS